MTTKRIEYVQMQYPRNRSRFTSMWLVLLLTSSFLLIKPAPATMAQSGQAPDLSASPQAEVAAIIHRKAVIWRPEDKWKTSTGYNWSAIESELQDMRNAGITWARIFFKQNESTAFLDQLIPLAGQYNVTILIVTMKSDPGKDLGTPEQQATYRTWLTNLVNRYKGSV